MEHPIYRFANARSADTCIAYLAVAVARASGTSVAACARMFGTTRQRVREACAALTLAGEGFALGAGLAINNAMVDAAAMNRDALVVAGDQVAIRVSAVDVHPHKYASVCIALAASAMNASDDGLRAYESRSPRFCDACFGTRRGCQQCLGYGTKRVPGCQSPRSAPCSCQEPLPVAHRTAFVCEHDAMNAEVSA